MKTRKPLTVMVIIAIVALALAFIACEGPMGPAGTNGLDGKDGEKGDKGDKGDPGASFLVWKGELAAAPTNPEPYWAYFNTTIGNAYIYTGTAWGLLSQHGADGVSIVWKGEGTSHPSGAQLNWAYYNSVDKKSYIYDGTAWQVLAKDGEVGPQGEPGSVTIVPDDGIDRISVTGPSKTGYSQGGVFSSAGLVVTAHYTDNSVATVTSGYALSWNGQPLSNSNTAITNALGDKTVTVDWRGKTETFTITVSDTNSFLITNTTQWNNALSLIRSNGNNQDYTLTISGDVGVGGITSANNNTTGLGTVIGLSVTLKGSGKLYLTSQGSILRVNNNQTLYIDSASLTLQGLTNGQNDATQDNNISVMYMTGANAKLELRDGVISGNTNNNNGSGGGVYVSNGTFIMSGGEISDNTASNGNGGGVYMDSNGNGSFCMSGGVINNNSALGSYNGGGGVSVSGDGFTMLGGEISGNTSYYGGGVCVNSNETFTMSGGEIFGNTASSGGGGVYSFGIFRIVTGTVYGSNESIVSLRNTANNGAALYASGTAERGSFSGTDGAWVSAESLTTTNNTIKVENGQIVP